MQRRDRGTAQSLGAPLIKKVKGSRVLLVGAGGIGCELLKNLVCCGFGSTQADADTQNGDSGVNQNGSTPHRRPEIVVIDLDTIDLSNLNRQFLFRKQHIKKAKATVAKETASQFNPAVHIDAHFASIYDKQYDVEFFEGFDIVFNALDNLAARRHVNRMCQAADVPLIESGTTGFNGQTQAIKRGVTACYDCTEKPVQKSFAICTIRSTPSLPIHCIVWAKSYLLPELFGASEEDSEDMTVTEGDNAEEVAKLKQEAEALKQLRAMMIEDKFAQKVFNKVFYEDIERLRKMEEMWKSRAAPTSLRFETLSIDKNPAEQGEKLALQDQKVWTIQDNLKVFCHSIDVLRGRVEAGETVIEFDKDDKATLDFVASAANLRSHIFGIEMSSEWNIKQMAGNIIPAIATSNALTASLCVLEAFKILRSQLQKSNGTTQPTAQQNGATNTSKTQPPRQRDAGVHLGNAKMVFLQSKSAERLIIPQALEAPNPTCAVCSPIYAKLILTEGQFPTLQDLVKLLRTRLGYDEFSISTAQGIVYDPELEDNLSKPLPEVGVTGTDNAFITVMDDADEPRVDLVLSAKCKPLPADEDADGVALRLLPAVIELPLKVKPAPAPAEDAADAEEETAATSAAGGAKRKREAEDSPDGATGNNKKAKAGSDDGVVVIAEEGAIDVDLL